MGRAVFPLCCLTWGQTMVEAMKIMATSFKRSLHALLPSCPQTCSKPLLTHASTGDSWTLTGKSGSVPWGGSLLLSPGSWCTQGFVCGLQESDSSVLCKFWWFYGGDNGDLQRAYAIPRFATPRAPAAGHCSPAPPQETLRHVSGSVSVGWACVLCCSQV